MSFDLISSLSELHKNEKFHGNIKPDIIIKDGNYWKILERFSNEKNFMSLIHKDLNNKKSIYLSESFFS